MVCSSILCNKILNKKHKIQNLKSDLYVTVLYIIIYCDLLILL